MPKVYVFDVGIKSAKSNDSLETGVYEILYTFSFSSHAMCKNRFNNIDIFKIYKA